MKVKKLKATHRLSEINVFEISLVQAPAVPDATIAFLKSKRDDLQEADPFGHWFEFTKIDKVKKQASGYCLVPDIADYYGDVASPEEVVKACHSFTKNLAFATQFGSGGGADHQNFAGVGYIIESSIDRTGSVAASFSVEADDQRPGGWWISFQVIDDDIWESIEKGERTGFSIAGLAKRVELPESDKALYSKAEPATGGDSPLFNRFLKALGIEKEANDFDANYLEIAFWRKLWAAVDAIGWTLEGAAYNYEMSGAEKIALIKTSLDQFKAEILAMIAQVKDTTDIFRAMATGEDLDTLRIWGGTENSAFYRVRNISDFQISTVERAEVMTDVNAKPVQVIVGKLKAEKVAQDGDPDSLVVQGYIFGHKTRDGARAWSTSEAMQWIDDNEQKTEKSITKGDSAMDKQELKKFFTDELAGMVATPVADAIAKTLAENETLKSLDQIGKDLAELKEKALTADNLGESEFATAVHDTLEKQQALLVQLKGRVLGTKVAKVDDGAEPKGGDGAEPEADPMAGTNLDVSQLPTDGPNT